MLQGWIVIAVALGYIGLLFVIASYGDRTRARKGWEFGIQVSGRDGRGRPE